MPSVALLKKVKLLHPGKSLQHAGVMLGGKAGVQLIALLSQPLLARLYSPAQFGEFALFNSILALLLIASCGRYETAIILAKRSQQAGRIFQLAQHLLLGFTILLGLLLIFAPLKNLPRISEIPATYLWFIPLLVLMSGYWQIVQNWLIRLKKFRQLSLTELIQRLLFVAGALTAFYLQLPLNGLILGLVLGIGGAFALALSYKRPVVKTESGTLKEYAHHYRDFPFYSVPTLLLNLGILHLPVLWISYYFTSQLAGSYSMAFMLISLPYTAICVSTAPVIYERLARGRVAKQHRLLIKICTGYGLFSLLLAAGVFCWGDVTISWLLSNKWELAGSIAIVLSPLIVCQGIEAWLMLSLSVFRQQGIGLYLQLSKLLLFILAFGLGTYFQDLFLSFKLISLFSVLHLLLLAYISVRICQKRDDSYSHRTLAKR